MASDEQALRHSLDPVPYTTATPERARAHLRAWIASHRDDGRPGMQRYVAELEAVLDRLDELEHHFRYQPGPDPTAVVPTAP